MVRPSHMPQGLCHWRIHHTVYGFGYAPVTKHNMNFSDVAVFSVYVLNSRASG